jgi:hypothetical protein
MRKTKKISYLSLAPQGTLCGARRRTDGSRQTARRSRPQVGAGVTAAAIGAMGRRRAWAPVPGPLTRAPPCVGRWLGREVATQVKEEVLEPRLVPRSTWASHQIDRKGAFSVGSRRGGQEVRRRSKLVRRISHGKKLLDLLGRLVG